MILFKREQNNKEIFSTIFLAIAAVIISVYFIGYTFGYILK